MIFKYRLVSFVIMGVFICASCSLNKTYICLRSGHFESVNLKDKQALMQYHVGNCCKISCNGVYVNLGFLIVFKRKDEALFNMKCLDSISDFSKSIRFKQDTSFCKALLVSIDLNGKELCSGLLQNTPIFQSDSTEVDIVLKFHDYEHGINMPQSFSNLNCITEKKLVTTINFENCKNFEVEVNYEGISLRKLPKTLYFFRGFHSLYRHDKFQKSMLRLKEIDTTKY